ncbi:gas vesicle protein [Bacilli bacterium PM5-9]|nr:gas vesicle protein [Bacilli bacterium PM5-9]
MKAKGLALFGLGVFAGLLLAPKKGSEAYDELKEKVNNVYLQTKELDIDSIKDKMYDIKIEVAKMDYDRSKEIVSNQATIIKEKLDKLITDLQENEKIKPAMANAVDATQKAIIDLIDYIDESELVDKTKEQVQKAYDKTSEYASDLKEKTTSIADNVMDKADDTYEKVAKQTEKIVAKKKKKSEA